VSDQCKEDRQISASSLYVRGKAHRAHGRALVRHARRGVRGLNQVGKSGRSKRANGDVERLGRLSNYVCGKRLNLNVTGNFDLQAELLSAGKTTFKCEAGLAIPP
jgi:hypothetical protein